MLLDQEGVVLMAEIHKGLRSLSIPGLILEWLSDFPKNTLPVIGMAPQLKLEAFFLHQVSVRI